MKKILVFGLTALSLLAINASAREYKCTDKDVIIAGLKADPSDRGISISERFRVLHGFRPWKIENIEQRGFTPKTMIGCMADTNGAYITYVIHIDKDTGKAYVLRSPARSQKTFKNSIKHGVSVEVK